MKKISIIVPVYNVEKELCRCIDSLVNQSFQNIEIILVNDGSTDMSGEICDEYAKQFSSVRCIHKKNGGLSSARNVGIVNACGEYIMFVDSDDFVKKHSCKKFNYLINKFHPEIIAADAYMKKDSLQYTALERGAKENIVYEGKEFFINSIKARNVGICAPYSIYERKFIVDNNLFFKEGIFYEDGLWTPQVYLKAKMVVYINYKFYYYCYRANSITNKKEKKHIEKRNRDQYNNCKILYKIYSKYPYSERKFLNDMILSSYMSILYACRKTNGNKKFILMNAYSLRNRIKGIIYVLSPRAYFFIVDCKRYLNEVLREKRIKS